MTKQEAIDKHIDRLGGLLLDACMEARKGAELSVWMRQVAYPKLKALIGDVFADAAESQATTNGHATREANTPKRN